MASARAIIDALGLSIHPEGGWYRETWRAPAAKGERAAGTAIYYLLERGQRSRWHRIDAAEIWHHYAGAPLILTAAEDADGPARDITLGPDICAGQRPQYALPPCWWQRARSTGEWSLMGCTVAPGFEFSGFEMAPDEFDIPR